MKQEEFLRINGIDVGFGSFGVEGTVYSDPKALTSEVAVQGGKLRINLLTPALELTEALHNGMLPQTAHADWIRFATYYDLAVPEGRYGTQIECPYGKRFCGFEVYGFPDKARFHGTIDVQEGLLHIRGELRPEYGDSDSSVPVEIVKHFDPRPLLPERQALTLEEALGKDPLDVYELRIGKGVFDAFPEQILSFANLESLWVGGLARFEFDDLPDGFYELDHLHTLLIYQSALKRISPRIDRLYRLETLHLESAALDRIPPEIGLLTALRSVSFKRNELTSLPEAIGRLPNLAKLDIEGNWFESLPASIAGIPGLRVTRKHKKLFMDTRYKSRNPDPIDEALFDLSRHPVERARLAAAIDASGRAASCKDFILDCSTMGTYLMHAEAGKEIPLGASKLGGTPDLPEGWSHPADKNGALHVFHGQINCEEAAPYQDYLPRMGMLYFFVNDEEYAQEPMVLHAKDSSRLKRYEYDADTRFTDPDFDNDVRGAIAVRFANAVSLPNVYNAALYGAERHPKYASFFNELREAEWKEEALEQAVADLKDQFEEPVGLDNGRTRFRTHSINTSVFTQHESPQEQAAARFGGEPDEWLVLLNLESIGEFSFWDAGTLTYCIHKKDLAIADFGTIHCSIESS